MRPQRKGDFPLFEGYSRFTDDTVLTLAVAEHLLCGSDLTDHFHDYFHRYADAGYGGTFSRWAFTRQREPYNSWGKGSARPSPQLSSWHARVRARPTYIQAQVETRFGYSLPASLDTIRQHYRFDVSFQGSVPQSLIAFLEADDYKGAVRNPVSLGRGCRHHRLYRRRRRRSFLWRRLITHEHQRIVTGGGPDRQCH